MLDRDQILAAKDIKSDVVSVPEWGGEVMVYGLTLEEKDKWNNSLVVDGKADMRGATAALCALSMRNEDGVALFTIGDVEALQSKSSAAMDRVFQVAQKLSGLGVEEIEEAVKNSEATQTEDSD